MADFETPELKEILTVPPVTEGVMADSKPYVAKAEFQEDLGFPGELVDNWEQVAVEKLGEIKAKYRSVQVFLDACVKCGACTD
ncbi:MAG TPA: (Fe-S)-binding protein, partial [Chromatiales bacterium]|nr:(Fe-S)-binding protein [Chromatiales bacterium]